MWYSNFAHHYIVEQSNLIQTQLNNTPYEYYIRRWRSISSHDTLTLYISPGYNLAEEEWMASGEGVGGQWSSVNGGIGCIGIPGDPTRDVGWE